MDRLLIRILLAIVAIVELASSKSLPGPTATYDQRQEGKVNVQIDVKDVQIVALVDSDTLDDYMSYDYAYDYSDFTIKPGTKPTTSKPASTATSTTELPSTKLTPSTEISSSTTSVLSDSTTVSSSATSNDSVAAAASSSSSSSSSTVANDSSSSTTTTAAEAISDDTPVAATAVVPVVALQTQLDNKENVTTDVSQKENERQKVTESSSSSSTITTASPSLIISDDIKPDGTKRPLGRPEARKKCPVGFLLKNGRCFKRRLSLISPRIALSKLAPALLSKAQALAQGAAAEAS